MKWTICVLLFTLHVTSSWRVPLSGIKAKRESNATNALRSTSSSARVPLKLAQVAPLESNVSRVLPPIHIAPLKPNIHYYVASSSSPSTSRRSKSSYEVLLSTSCSLKMSSLNCDSIVKLRALPLSIEFPEFIEFVDFRNNRIAEIFTQTFAPGSRVKSLFLANNALSAISANTFVNLGNLTHLDLSHNRIINIDDYAFNGLQMLNVIDLGYNRIQNLSKTIFAQTDESKFHLKELRLNHNELKELNGDVFEYLFYIDALDLEDNIIEQLPEAIFNSNVRLRDLKLSMNHFQKVPTAALQSAKTVEILDLSSNRFRELTFNDFTLLTSLNRLRISRVNTLERIDDYTFSHLINLRTLNIEYNRKLRRISSKAFHFIKPSNSNTTEAIVCSDESCRNLQALDNSTVEEVSNNSIESDDGHMIKYSCDLIEISLRGNALITLHRDTLPWDKIKEVDLSDNPWRCDCHLQWFANLTYDERTEEQFLCKTPYKHFNQRVKLLTPDDFTCSLLQNDVFIVGGVLLMIILATGLTSIGFLINKLKIIPKIISYLRYPKQSNLSQQYSRVEAATATDFVVQFDKTQQLLSMKNVTKLPEIPNTPSTSQAVHFN